MWQRLIQLLRSSLLRLLVRFGLLALVGLTLYGIVPKTTVVILLLLFVSFRGLLLAFEATTRRYTEADWARQREDARTECSVLARDELAEIANRFGLDESASVEHVATAAVGVLRRTYVAPRPRGEVGCEALGLLAFCLVLPPTILFFSRDFVSLRGSFDVGGLCTGLLCLALYAGPFIWPIGDGWRMRRMLWWGAPLLPALVAFQWGLTHRHPYLDPLNPDRERLAAMKVLSLSSNVTAGGHADWVFRYASHLANEGESEPAIELYRRGLTLSPTSESARRSLAALEGRPLASVANPGREAAARRAREPLWGAGRQASPLPVCEVGPALREMPASTTVLVRFGEIDSGFVDAIGEIIERELGIPVCVASRSVPLPDATRVRGIKIGRQWSNESLIKAFIEELQPPGRIPHRYLLLTSVDIYSPETNFVFSSSYEWGALLSSARYARIDDAPRPLIERTGKQALGALVKGFGLPPSSDPLCVTSYTNGPAQFDAKGNRPTRETLARLQAVLARWEDRWAAARGR